ncbi:MULTISPECIES: hypothetical protein [Cysteiniphilum]|uniref:Uncharacterized protein n=1 Tax=Cysteiniphilum litorale TaxID=2056700 RepID=A0A8J2Z2Y7_9GAMM|nr:MULTISPECIES: hypothetical protein [Cysteiniphilum]GGF91521.1 hypothetical protein GCM10010995_05930 [Cysteiniphilum litorale]
MQVENNIQITIEDLVAEFAQFEVDVKEKKEPYEEFLEQVRPSILNLSDKGYTTKEIESYLHNFLKNKNQSDLINNITYQKISRLIKSSSGTLNKRKSKKKNISNNET